MRYYNGVQWTADVAVDGELRYDRPPPQLIGLPQQTWAPRPAPRSRAAAVTSFVLSICALVTGWMPFVAFLAVVTVILAIVFGFVGLRRADAQGGHGKGLAVAGLAISVPAVLACILGIVLSVSLWQALQEWTNPGNYEVVQRECAVVDGRISWEGTIRNLDDRMRSYTLRLVLDDGEIRRVRTLRVDDVLGGQNADVRTSALGGGGTTATCDLTDVNGPEPWGVDMSGG